MARSRKRKSKMSQKRLDSVKKIEQASQKDTSPLPFKSTGSPKQTPRPTDYAADKSEIDHAREIGLSVPSNATAGQLHRQLDEFELAKNYVQDLFIKITSHPYTQTDIDEKHFNRFVANLLADGRLATKIAATQQKRNAKNNPPIRKNNTYRAVKNHLYAQFHNDLPKQSILSKILG